MNLPRRIANLHRRLERITGKEIFQCCRAGSRSYGHAAQERNAASGIAKRAAAHGVTVQLATKLEGVRSYSVGNMIDELCDRVRPLKFRPLECAQAGHKGSGEADARQPSGEGPAHAGVKAIS